MKKLIIILTLVLSTGLISGCVMQDYNRDLAYNLIGEDQNADTTIEWEAQALYEQRKGDFDKKQWEKGPCLGQINDEWVVDIVHRTRIDTDYDLTNQCQDYYKHDKIKHYILLDMNGNVVATK